MTQAVDCNLPLYVDDKCLLCQHKLISLFVISKVTYLGCKLQDKLSGEPMAFNVINKVNGGL